MACQSEKSWVKPGTACSSHNRNTILKRVRLLRQELEKLSPQSTLDAGCGLGIYLPLLREYCPNVVGIDINYEYLTQARLSHLDERTHHVMMSMEKMALQSSIFDLVICIETLEHIPEDISSIMEFRRLLRVGGRCVITVPYKWFPFETHGISIGSTVISSPFGIGFPLLTFFPSSVRRLFATARVYTKRGLCRQLKKNGFHPLNVFFLMPGLDTFHKKAGNTIFPRIAKLLSNHLERALSRFYGSTMVVIAEAVDLDV